MEIAIKLVNFRLFEHETEECESARQRRGREKEAVKVGKSLTF